jgi:hypothetical protein
LRCSLHERRPRLGEPKGHVHGTVEVDCRGELSVCLLRLACPGMQHSQAKMAVGLERAHAECLGEGEGLAVIAFGWLDLQRILPRRDLAEDP